MFTTRRSCRKQFGHMNRKNFSPVFTSGKNVLKNYSGKKFDQFLEMEKNLKIDHQTFVSHVPRRASVRASALK